MSTLVGYGEPPVLDWTWRAQSNQTLQGYVEAVLHILFKIEPLLTKYVLLQDQQDDEPHRMYSFVSVF